MNRCNFFKLFTVTSPCRTEYKTLSSRSNWKKDLYQGKKNCIRLQWHSRPLPPLPLPPLPLPLPLSWEEGLWLCGRGSAVVSHSWHWSLDERVGMVTGCSDLPLQSPRGPRAAPSTDLIIYRTRFVFTGCSCGSLCLILWLLYVFFRLR